jgi:hypothetical protein
MKLSGTEFDTDGLPTGAAIIYAQAHEDGSSVTQMCDRLDETRAIDARVRAVASMIDAAFEMLERAGLDMEDVLAHWTDGGQVACMRCGSTFLEEDGSCERCGCFVTVEAPEDDDDDDDADGTARPGGAH